MVDEFEDAVPLIREVATKIKRGSGIVSGRTVNYCLGDYRVTFVDESIDSAPASPPESRRHAGIRGGGRR